MPSPWLLLLAAISCEVIGTALLKGSDGMTRPGPTLVGLLAYQQVPSTGQLLGMGLIACGVVVVNLSGPGR